MPGKVMAARKEQTHPIDAHVGARMRLRRLEMRMSQTALAERLGISFQAVQKYEIGAVRLSASRLYDAALALAVRPGFFFDGVPGTPSGGELAPRDVAALVRSYHAIRDERLKTEVRRLVASLGSANAE